MTCSKKDMESKVMNMQDTILRNVDKLNAEFGEKFTKEQYEQFAILDFKSGEKYTALEVLTVLKIARILSRDSMIAELSNQSRMIENNNISI